MAKQGMTNQEFNQTVNTLYNVCELAIYLLNRGFVIGVNNLNVLEYDKLGSALQDMVESLEMDRDKYERTEAFFKASNQ